MQHEKGIVFYKDRNSMIRSYGKYLGGVIYNVLTNRIKLDVHLGIDLPPFYNYYIMGNHILIG